MKGKRNARERLIAAAREVMGRDGVEGSSIPAIVAAAKVGVGSFYSNFASKEDLARVIFMEQTIELRAEFDQVARSSDDMARAISFVYRRCLDTAIQDPVWGWFFVHADSVLQDVDRLLHESAHMGLARGLQLGQLTVRDTETVTTLLLASVSTLVRAMLKGQVTEADAHAASEYILRIVGIDAAEARQIADESMEELGSKLKVGSKSESGRGR